MIPTKYVDTCTCHWGRCDRPSCISLFADGIREDYCGECCAVREAELDAAGYRIDESGPIDGPHRWVKDRTMIGIA